MLVDLSYKVHTILNGNGSQFSNIPHQTHALFHILGRVCKENGIERRLVKLVHPSTNGQVERMNRTIKEARVQ